VKSLSKFELSEQSSEKHLLKFDKKKKSSVPNAEKIFKDH
jgi:hypothetical protein